MQSIPTIRIKQSMSVKLQQSTPMLLRDKFANSPNGLLSGRQYQDLRSDLSNEAANSSGGEANSLRSMRDALDDEMRSSIIRHKILKETQMNLMLPAISGKTT